MVWSQVCIQNMARLAKEATTVRRVLEPMFRYFDTEKHWPPEKLAIIVLQDLQHFMETSGYVPCLYFVAVHALMQTVQSSSRRILIGIYS